MCYSMEEYAKEILLQVLPKFTIYFSSKKNMIFERCKLNSRSQLPDENVDSFITTLYLLAKHCEYNQRCGTIKDELIRDRIVIRNSKTSERLQLKADLTLSDAITIR
ncbi:hypothetical protein ALC53_04341 [Atta colombica]|uniref:Uncharacterized protein n=1 Tax=Atta colombica TaxID=520822 RepID=A0A151I5E5_9HYME|nr:hypothetical protein ALC53_04341 [Atta colombica]